MSASSPLPPPLPLLKRIPPGLWTALAWYAAAVEPIVEYVVTPPRRTYSLNYPRDGLDSLGAQALLAVAFVLVLAGSAMLRRRTFAAYGLVIVGTVISTVAWRQDEIPPTQFLAVDIALCYLAATRPRRTSLTAAAAALGTLAGYLVLRLITGDDSSIPQEPFVALTVVIAWLIGNSSHQARAHTAELHARVAAEAVTAERLRIAREMHDTVAHSIGIIALQAGAAARVIETQPAKAREAMLTVETAAARRCPGCGGCSARCARPTRTRNAKAARMRRCPCDRPPVWRTWNSSPRRPRPPASAWRCGGRAGAARCRPTSTSRHSGSSRSR